MGKDESKNREEVEPVAQPSPGLGKEAKIGIVVITLLLVGLGAAITWRLMRSTPDDSVASVPPPPEGGKEKPHDNKIDPMFKENRMKPFGAGVPPTVVPVKESLSKPPKSSVGDLDQWKFASDHGESRRPKKTDGPSLDGSALVPPAPKPPRSESADPFAVDHSKRKDGFKAAEGSSPLRNRDGDVRLMMPDDVDKVRPPRRRASDDSSGFASVDPTSPSPAYRDNPRRDPPSPPSYRSGSSHGDRVAATPVGQHDMGEGRRDFSMPRRNDPPRRSFANNPPPSRDDGKYEVQPNDSYWIISERLYGVGAYFKALAQHNQGRGMNDEQLQPGTLILAPSVAELEKQYPDLCPKATRRDALQSQERSRMSTVSSRGQFRNGRTYTVAEGDTLFNIARYELGKASRWVEIYELNRDVLGKDFNYLTPGIQLTMPEGEKSDVIAQPPRNTYQR